MSSDTFGNSFAFAIKYEEIMKVLFYHYFEMINLDILQLF